MAEPDRINTPYLPLEGGTVPRARRKAPSKWLTPGRSCLIFSGFFGLLCTAGVGFLVYKVAGEAWRALNIPHGHTHANAALVAPHGVVPIETDVVRSFFGPQKDGGVDKFDLRAAIWARVLKPYVHWDGTFSVWTGGNSVASCRANSLRLIREDTPWALVHDSIVLKDVPIEAKALHTVEQVRFPKSLVCVFSTSPPARDASR